MAENLFCAGTYHKVLQKIAQPAIEGADIRYRTRVVEVHGKSTTAKGTVQLVTDNGQWLEFDEVVLTTPLGWLKQNLEAFTPPLPERLSRAIQSIGYGCLEKVCIGDNCSHWKILTPLDFPGLHLVPQGVLAVSRRCRPGCPRLLSMGLAQIRP